MVRTTNDVEQRAVTERARFGWLDGLKAVALAWIVLNHIVEPIAGFPYIANPARSWPPLSERIAQLAPVDGLGVWTIPANILRYLGWFGDQGVQLFLIASGFGLMWAAMQHSWEGWWPYLQRRSSRIFPLWWGAHLALLVLSIAAAVAFGSSSYGVSPTDPQFYLSLAGIRFFLSTLYYGVPAWWYIGLAIQLYLVFPWMASWLRRFGAIRFLLGAVIIGTVARLVGLLTFDAYLDAWSRGAIFITRIPEFALGMAVAAWFAHDEDTARRLVTRPAALLAAVVTYAVATLLSLTLVGNAISPLLLGASAFVLLFWLFDWFGKRASSRWVSTHTYGIYLSHQAFILLAVEAAALAGLSAALTGMSIVVAVVVSVVAALGLEWIVGFVRRLLENHGAVSVAAGLAVSLGVVVVVLLAGELAVQRFAPQEVLGWGERPALVASDRAGWHLRPDTATRLRWQGYDYEATANALGYPGPNPSGTGDTVRIVTMGDAFTSAEGVDTGQAWPRVLESTLESDGQDYEVVNLAITGYGPEQHAAVAEDYLQQLAPDIVVVGLFVNDFFDVEWTNEDFQSSIGFGRPDPFGVVATLQLSHLRELIRSQLVAPLVETATSEPNPAGYFLGNFKALEREGISPPQEILVEHHLDRVVAGAHAAGAEVFFLQIPASVQVCSPGELAYYPAGVDLASDDYDLEAPQRSMSAIADRLDVRSDDLRPVLGAMHGCPYFSFNMHWTASAHQIVGQHVAELLERWAILESDA